MNEHTSKIVAALGVLVASLGLVLFAAKWEPVSVNISPSQVASPTTVDGGELGTGNMALFTSVAKADIIKTTDNTTTTCSMLNNDADGKARWISDVQIVLDGTNGSTGAAATIRAGTSTSAVGAVVGNGKVFHSQALTTSTAPITFSTTTLLGINREWPYNSYLNFKISTATVSSTEGLCAVRYNKEPAS